MGVRFRCPNGHKLNVKATLAGKRAICPECGAKLTVPAESESGATAAEPTTAQPIGSSVAAELPQVAPSVAVPSGDVWYVRPSNGGQFGPATTEVARGWLAEGRIAQDSWLWRTGWPEWKLGNEAIALLQSDSPTSSAGSPDEKHSSNAAATAEPSDASPPGTAETTAPNLARRSRRRSRKERARQLTLALGMVVLVLSVLLAFVLWK